MNILVTGVAGFIGSNLIDRLMMDTHNHITCIDNFDPYYDRSIKENNIAKHIGNPRFRLLEADIRDYATLEQNLTSSFDVIFHLAAKAGVRPSIANPREYNEVNITGTQNILEIARKLNVKQFVFASSSSVYGINPNYPWKESDQDMLPISPYASSKLSCEFMGHVYSNLFGIRFIALRFFTVFGPRQRPDLAIHKFFKQIENGEPITLFGNGDTLRDYTYVDDVVEALLTTITYHELNYEIFNIGNHSPVKLIDLIGLIEKTTARKAILEFAQEQAGDVPITYANTDKANNKLGFKNKYSFEDGLKGFYNWYLKTYTDSKKY